MTDLESALFDDILSSTHGSTAVLMGDDDFVELAKSLASDATRFNGLIRSDQFFEKNDIRIFGALVMTNATPRTKGWIVGEEEVIKGMRDVIWMKNYIRLFRDTPSGLVQAYARKPEP